VRATVRIPSSPELIEALRARIAETIPPGGTEDDTLFTDRELELIILAADSFEQAVSDAMRAKALKIVDQAAAGPVEVRFGAESYRFLDPLEHARFWMDEAKRLESGGGGSLWVGIDELPADDGTASYLEGETRPRTEAQQYAKFSTGDPWKRELPNFSRR
jgi:hypothetical protein